MFSYICILFVTFKSPTLLPAKKQKNTLKTPNARISRQEPVRRGAPQEAWRPSHVSARISRHEDETCFPGGPLPDWEASRAHRNVRRDGAGEHGTASMPLPGRSCAGKILPEEHPRFHCCFPDHPNNATRAIILLIHPSNSHPERNQTAFERPFLRTLQKHNRSSGKIRSDRRTAPQQASPERYRQKYIYNIGQIWPCPLQKQRYYLSHCRYRIVQYRS